MGKKIAFLFPGQGAQYIGMGKDFYNNFSLARTLFEEANDILHLDLAKIIFEGSEDELKKTIYSQLTIFLTSVVFTMVFRQENPEILPTVCAGLSLGEYSALYASGKISFKDALFLVQKRANYMNDACEKIKGTMAAIIGLDSDIIEETVAKINPPHLVWVANYNTVDQTVISGTLEGVSAAMAALQELGAKKALFLKVQGAFHSGLMVQAQERLKKDIENSNLFNSNIDLIMNVTGNYAKSIEEIKKYLILQVTNSVRWKQTLETLDKHDIEIYLEIGPSKTISMMVKKNRVKGEAINLESVSDLEQLSKGRLS